MNERQIKLVFKALRIALYILAYPQDWHKFGFWHKFKAVMDELEVEISL
jgi:hypothetical protein